MTEKNSKTINDFCMTAKLLGMSRKETLEKLMHTTAVKESPYNEVMGIFDGYFKSEEVKA